MKSVRSIPALDIHLPRGILLLSLLGSLSGCERQNTPPATSSSLADAAGASPGVAQSHSTPWFREVAAESGIDFRHVSGHATRFLMPEINTGGVGLLDIDNDGRMDVFCVNGGFADPSIANPPGHRLYRNLGAWRFENVSASAGIGANSDYGIGIACADYDADGWTDVYLLNLRKNRLYRNLGNGQFQDVTDWAGVGGDEWSSSAVFFDFDRDGHLDLFVANYLHWSVAAEVDCSSRGGEPDYCSPLNYKAPAADRLFRNRGDGTFEDVTSAMGIDRLPGTGMGVATGDFDGDGWVDVFVANDAMPNRLWMNRTGRGFVDEAAERGCALNALGIPRAGMGVVTVDFTGKGQWDLFVTHLVGEGNGWFANANGHFSDRITSSGPTRGSLPFTGFGTAFRDFDHDGRWDLFVANGRVRLGARDLVETDRYAEPNLLLRGVGEAEFSVVAPGGGTDPALVSASRGAAFGDLDNDGRDDVVVLNKDGPVHVLRNISPGSGHWLGFDCRERDGTVARNARVVVRAGEATWVRQIQPNEGYASSHDPRLVFGLGNHVTADITVRWLDGTEQRFGNRAAGRYHLLRR